MGSPLNINVPEGRSVERHRLSECLSECQSVFRQKWIKFGEQTSRILEFKPEGLEG